jgi:hypothetical protein
MLANRRQVVGAFQAGQAVAGLSGTECAPLARTMGGR